jgi:hypothetical protein
MQIYFALYTDLVAKVTITKKNKWDILLVFIN